MGVQGMFVGVVVLSCTEEKFEKINKEYKKIYHVDVFKL